MKQENPLVAETLKVLNATPDQRLHALIDSPFTAEILERMPTHDAYLMVKEAFGSDSSILLPYTPTEKIVSFIDLDCWDRDTLSAESFLAWITELVEASDETLLKTLESLDIEVIILLFQPFLQVIITRPTDDNIPELVENGYETFDNNYFFAFSDSTEETAMLKHILDLLYLNHQDIYYRILEGVSWELPSDMEETAYQHRMLRLMELGFPAPDEARAVYRRVPTERLLARGLRPDHMPRFGQEEYYIPSLYQDELRKGALVETLRCEVDGETQRRLSFELVYLANKVIMADYLPLNDAQAIRASLGKVMSFTALGLALAKRAKAQTTQALLDGIDAESLFSLGYNAVREQQIRLKECLAGVPEHMIPPLSREIMEALLSQTAPQTALPWSSLEQFDTAAAMIDHLDTLRRIIRHIPWKGHALTDTNIDTQGLDMQNILLTALAVNISTGDLTFRPLNLTELSAFIDRTTMLKGAVRHLRPGLLNDLATLLAALDPDIPSEPIQFAAAGLMTRWEEEVAGVSDPGRFDPRYLTCLVVKLTD
ncbi:MAG: DUF6178 family protein [Syntrophaceae bacterium]